MPGPHSLSDQLAGGALFHGFDTCASRSANKGGFEEDLFAAGFPLGCDYSLGLHRWY